MKRPDPIRHPGPVRPDRLMLAPGRARALAVELPSGRLDHAFDAALSGLSGAYLVLQDVSADPLRFVLPDHAPDDSHAAWYSPEQRLSPATILRAGVIWGQKDGRGFSHIHGLWRGEGGVQAGHLLAHATHLTAAVKVTGWAIDGASFRAMHDPETGFALFQPQSDVAPAAADAALLRIAPNEDVLSMLQTACARLGWQAAQVQGIGSLNHAVFADGGHLPSYATEFLIDDGHATPESATLSIDIVGIGGQFMSGPLAPGNTICVTAELLMLRSD